MFERKSSKPQTPDPSPAASATPEQPAVAKPPTPAKRTEGVNAVIGSKVKVNGDIMSSEDLLVEGEVTGTITLSENELVIGTSGRVQANISAKTVRIEGEVKGDIDGSERVVICASGNVQGNVSSPRVMLEDGGRFKGSIDMGGSKPAAAAATKPAAGAKPEVHSIDKAG
ncbi:bactofilin family protein [Congregibacter litoralis]|uniref:Integral membrane protein CcmA involved in cell shape determination n=1 Tax=Congregibacter litoralis KT71 TaxID=314285 RepID=A4ABH0_9GAMM|nr:polymer-forming cytoskeletal protein [Congregibacter litoralis]EAQ96724.1 Integral membrane protein CcmA involved in cell shape determination [Congregibacter litoralis KT71]